MSINGAPRDIQQISPIVDLFTKVDVVVRFAHLQTIMDRLQERAKHSTRKDDSISVQQKRTMEYIREGVLVDLIMLELADSR